jgi:hypothetical protein
MTDGNRVLDIELKTHEIPTKRVTPKGDLSWYIKWVGTILIIIAMILTTNNLFPFNMFFQTAGVICWLVVSVLWNDRALIVLNSVALALFANGLLKYLLEEVIT